MDVKTVIWTVNSTCIAEEPSLFSCLLLILGSIKCSNHTVGSRLREFFFTINNPLTTPWVVISPYIAEEPSLFSFYFKNPSQISLSFSPKNKANPLVGKTEIWVVILPYIAEEPSRFFFFTFKSQVNSILEPHCGWSLARVFLITNNPNHTMGGNFALYSWRTLTFFLFTFKTEVKFPCFLSNNRYPSSFERDSLKLQFNLSNFWQIFEKFRLWNRR